MPGTRLHHAIAEAPSPKPNRRPVVPLERMAVVRLGFKVRLDPVVMTDFQEAAGV